MFPDAGRGTSTSRWRRLVWVLFGMVYLFVWPLAGMFGHGRSTPEIIMDAAALFSFSATFIGLVIVNNPWSAETTRATWILVGVCSVMAIVYPLALGGDWGGLPIYLGVAYAMTLPPAWASRGVVATAVLTLVVSLAGGAPGSTTALLAFETLTIGMLILGFRHSRILVAQLQEARGEVARLAANEERLRISRDLHDLLGHTLSLIVLKSEVAARLADRDPGKSLGEVEDIGTVARQALADVREAVSGYRQRTLTDELDNARGVLHAAGVDLTIATSGTPLPDPLDGLFGWAVREGVTNIVRHARARTTRIAIRRESGSAILEITDDGVGPASDGSGNGLDGLGERAARSGGTVEAGPGPHGGFQVVVHAPLVPGEGENADDLARA